MYIPNCTESNIQIYYANRCVIGNVYDGEFIMMKRETKRQKYTMVQFQFTCTQTFAYGREFIDSSEGGTLLEQEENGNFVRSWAMCIRLFFYQIFIIPKA